MAQLKDLVVLGSARIVNNMYINGTCTAKNFSNNGSDFAELFETSENIEPGDIVALDINSETENYKKADNKDNVIVGVCSDEYAFLAGSQNVENTKVAVGLKGRVHTKFKGTAKIGSKVYVSDEAGVGCSDPNGEFIGYLTEQDDLTEIRKLKVLLK